MHKDRTAIILHNNWYIVVWTLFWDKGQKWLCKYLESMYITIEKVIASTTDLIRQLQNCGQDEDFISLSYSSCHCFRYWILKFVVYWQYHFLFSIKRSSRSSRGRMGNHGEWRSQSYGTWRWWHEWSSPSFQHQQGTFRCICRRLQHHDLVSVISRNMWPLCTCSYL